MLISCFQSYQFNKKTKREQVRDDERDGERKVITKHYSASFSAVFFTTLWFTLEHLFNKSTPSAQDSDAIAREKKKRVMLYNILWIKCK